jgi:L-threonylcarbamoyladenylate synthase
VRRLAIDARAPEPAVVSDAAAVVRAGRVVAIPTDTLYGLAADPWSAAAIARVFAVKGRDAAQALPLIAADLEQATEWIGTLPSAGVRLARRYWPGPLSLVVRRPSNVPPELCGGLETLAVRVPAHEVARALCRACGRPLTATSANLSGQPPSSDPEVVAASVGSRIDLLLDAGPTPGGPPSTIVDVTGAELALVRPGAIPWEELIACVGA